MGIQSDRTETTFWFKHNVKNKRTELGRVDQNEQNRTNKNPDCMASLFEGEEGLTSNTSTVISRKQ